MKKTNLVKHGNYGLSFSEYSKIPLAEKNISSSTDSDDSWKSLVYEISTSNLDFRNMVLSGEQNMLIKSLLEERKKINRLKEFNLPLTSKVLLYWPPGTGKTLTSYCLAWALKKKLLTVNLSTLISSKLWETAKNLDKIFSRAMQLGAVLFIDEFDSISRDRDFSDDHWEMRRVVNVLLQIFDLSNEDTIVLAATNRIKDVDSALLRRFDLSIEYKLPSKLQIKEYLSFMKLTYNFSFSNHITEKEFIKFYIGKNYSDIKRSIVNLLKRLVVSHKRVKNVILKKSDLDELIKITTLD